MIQELGNNLCFEKDIIQLGNGDKIGVNRVYKKEHEHNKNNVFMIPGANADFWTSFSEIAKYLALRDIDVYGIDFRYSFISDCSDGCTFMKEWDTETHISDIDTVITTLHLSSNDIIILGFSMGAYYAYKYAERHPELKGIMAIDIVYTLDSTPENIPLINATDNEILRLKETRICYEDVSTNIYMANLALNTPDGQSPIIEGMTNKQAFLLAVTATYQFGFSVPNYIYAQGDITGLKYTNYDFIIEKAMNLNPFQSIVPTIELYNQWIHPTVPNISSPLFYLGAEFGFGALGLYVPNTIKLYNENVDTLIVEDYGHADLIWSENDKIKHLICEWIKKQE